MCDDDIKLLPTFFFSLSPRSGKRQCHLFHYLRKLDAFNERNTCACVCECVADWEIDFLYFAL